MVPSLADTAASAPPAPTDSVVSGAWPPRDLPSQKPTANLSNSEEVIRIQRLLIERGYLLGPADGIWGPWSHATLEDLRRTQGDGEAPRAPKSPTPPRIAEAAQEDFLPTTPYSAETSHTTEAQREPPPRTPPDAPRNGRAEQGVPDATTPAKRSISVPAPRRQPAYSYVGAWARSPAACFRNQTPPLQIWPDRAASFGGLAGGCEFGQVRRKELGWRTRARCNADGRSWTANIQLAMEGSTLIWSSERGTATYFRCK